MTTQTVRGTDLVVKLDGEDQMPALDIKATWLLGTIEC
jgi:hypothetical protein